MVTLTMHGEDAMENIEALLKTALGEVEQLLNTKTVIGEPITIEGNTLIPLVSIGFGFGAGGGSGKGDDPLKGEGAGAGTGGGGGIKPVAIIIINQDGVRVEPIKGGAASAFEKIGEAIAKCTAGHTAGKANDKGEGNCGSC